MKIVLQLAGVDPDVFFSGRDVALPIQDYGGQAVLDGDGLDTAGQRSGLGWTASMA
jgi:hypothetical protein